MSKIILPWSFLLGCTILHLKKAKQHQLLLEKFKITIPRELFFSRYGFSINCILCPGAMDIFLKGLSSHLLLLHLVCVAASALERALRAHGVRTYVRVRTPCPTQRAPPPSRPTTVDYYYTTPTSSVEYVVRRRYIMRKKGGGGGGPHA